MKNALFLISFLEMYKKGMTLEDAIRFAHKSGFQAVEFTDAVELSQPDIQHAKELAKLCKELNLAVPCFSMPADLGNDSWLEQVEILKRYIDVADTLGAKLFHHTLIPGLSFNGNKTLVYSKLERQIMQAVNTIQTYASKFGIRCVYEDQGFVINGVKNFEKFYKGVPLPNKGVVADLGNIYFFDEEPLKFVTHFINDIAHVHIKDYL